MSTTGKYGKLSDTPEVVMKKYGGPKKPLMDSYKYAIECRYRSTVQFWERTIKDENLKKNTAKLYKAGRCVRSSIIFVVVGGFLGFIGYQQFL